MKTYSDQLFQLVKAMSPNEKLYFKAFRMNKKQPDDDYFYIALFDTLNAMKVYDEAVLRKKLKKAGFNHNPKKAKRYLYETILKSLAEYHIESSADGKIQNLILQAEILYKKNFKKQADQLLHKAEKLSLDFEKYEYLLMISSLKANLALGTADLEGLKELTNTGIKKEQKDLDMYINTRDYRNLAVEVGSLYNQSPEIISEDRSVDIRLKELFNHALLKDSKTALTFSAKQYFYKLHYQHIVHTDKLGGKLDERSYRMLKEWVTYLEKQEDMQNNYPEVYIQALSYLLNSSVSKGGHESETIYTKGYNFYMTLPKKNKNHIVQRAFINIFVQHTDAQLKLLHPEKCIDAFADISRLKLSPSGYMNMAFAYFALSRYSEALSFVNKVVNEKSNYRMDVQAIGRMLVLIIHYELRNIDLLPYVSQNNERWLIKNKYPLGSFDKALIRFFKYKLPKMDSIDEERQEFLNLLTHLKEGKNSGDSILHKEDFYLRPWLESKIQNRPLMEVIKEKAISQKG